VRGSCSPQVVGGADERPFDLHFLDAAQQELPEPSCLFDLSEHRLDDLLSQSIATLIACPLELGGHLGDQRAGSGWLGCGGRLGAVFLSPGGDVGFDVAPLEGAKVGVRTLAGVDRHLVGVPAESGSDPVKQWWQLRLIAGGTGQRLRHNDLMGAVDRPA
jgi:hypothetical protein